MTISYVGAGSRRKTTARKGTARPPVRRVKRKRPAARRRTSPAWLRFVRFFGLRVAVLGLVGLVAAGMVVGWYARDLPEVGDLASARRLPRVVIEDRHGTIIGIRGQDRGTAVDSSTLPPHVVGAFLATEDRNFFYHVGVNPVAIIRALLINVKEGSVAQGGSTITQQLVKNLVLTSDQTVKRKVQEMILALKIERNFTKPEILSLYLNAVYFGNGAYGLEAAARRYFAKPPAELTVGEAAMLAGLLKAPSELAPTSDRNAARARARTVLEAMVDAEYITAAEARAVLDAGIASIATSDRHTDYAADHAYAEVRQLIGEIDRDLIVRTTVDGPAIERVAGQRARIAAADPLLGPKVETAMLALEEHGAIRILIGGNDYRASEFNRATQARRQPGSVFKTFVYLAALENGKRPNSYIEDREIKVGDYAPTNYKDVYAGRVTMTEAMARSLNSAAIGLQEELGQSRVLDAARRAGFPRIKEDVGASLALGTMSVTPLDVAKSFLPLSNGGLPADPYVIDRVTAADGTVLYRRPATSLAAADQAFETDVLIAIDHMLRYVVASGSGSAAKVNGHVAAGKTGTSQNNRDAWFAGYVSGMVGVVWLGKDDDTPMSGARGDVAGSGAPSRLWSAMMTEALGDRPARKPIPYVPPRDRRNLFQHIAHVLGRDTPEPVDGPSAEELNAVIPEDNAEAPSPPDELSALLESVTETP